MFEKYSQEGSDIESLPEDARVLLSDKDVLVNALQVGLLLRFQGGGG